AGCKAEGRGHDRRSGGLDDMRRSRDALDHERRIQRTEAVLAGDVEKTRFGQRGIERVTVGRHHRLGVGGQGQTIEHALDLVEHRGLVVGECELHGLVRSEGRSSQRRAMRLSWISAAPEAMPAAIARWWCATWTG